MTQASESLSPTKETWVEFLASGISLALLDSLSLLSLSFSTILPLKISTIFNCTVYTYSVLSIYLYFWCDTQNLPFWSSVQKSLVTLQCMSSSSTKARRKILFLEKRIPSWIPFCFLTLPENSAQKWAMQEYLIRQRKVDGKMMRVRNLK